MDGSLGGALTVFPNAILGGNGTVGNVVNNGRTEPGSSIGTLTVNGNYIQGPSGILGIEISETGATDLLQVTGTATLNGVLQISPEPGVYLAGTAYTFLTAGSVTGQFSSSFSDLPLNYTINYFPDRAQLFVLSSSLVLPPRPSGNAGAVADYLFCSSFDFADVDLDTVAESLLILPSGQYKKALNRLTPSQFGSLALTELENNFTIANAFFLARLDQKSCCADMCKSTSIWINPLGSVYSQKSHLEIGQEAIGFTNHTYGVTAGIDHILSNNWNLGLGLGYAHSHVHWKNQAGRAYANSGYLGPCLRYDSQHFYFDFLILGAGNFYDVHRKIQFPGLFRQAKSHPRNWNLSEIVLAGFNLEADANVFVRPEILLDQLNVFQESFCEKGADSINLSVKRKYSSFLRSLINLKIVKEWAFCDTCVVPSVNIGWLRTTPLSGRHYTASFRSDTFCQPNFSVTSFDQIIDQVLVGVQFLIASQGGGVAMSLGYDGRFGEGTKVNEINTALDWKF